MHTVSNNLVNEVSTHGIVSTEVIFSLQTIRIQIPFKIYRGGVFIGNIRIIETPKQQFEFD